jgi:hypothetical protein
MAAKNISKISDLIPDPNNANKGTERGLGIVEDSLRNYGAGRSIVIDKNGVVIAGNKTLESAASIGLEIEVVKTKGDKLVVVQRTDLDLSNGDNRARKLAYTDNRAGELGLEWDIEQITVDMDDGLDLSGLFTELELENIGVEVPKFEPVGLDEQGKVDELNKKVCPNCGEEF